jgi:hypothetical protein
MMFRTNMVRTFDGSTMKKSAWATALIARNATYAGPFPNRCAKNRVSVVEAIVTSPPETMNVEVSVSNPSEYVLPKICSC